MTVSRIDISVEDHGSIFVLRGRTNVGRDWIEENCQQGDYNPFGSGARLVEHRFVDNILVGATGAGLAVEIA